MAWAYSSKKVEEIRGLYKKGISVRFLAKQYFICESTVRKYVKDIKLISKAKIRKDFLRGLSVRKIARKYNISSSTAYKYTKDILDSDRIHPRKVTLVQENEMQKMYKNGISKTVIAKHFDKSIQCINAHLNLREDNKS